VKLADRIKATGRKAVDIIEDEGYVTGLPGSSYYMDQIEARAEARRIAESDRKLNAITARIEARKVELEEQAQAQADWARAEDDGWADCNRCANPLQHGESCYMCDGSGLR
jgi:hypothetical protein